MDHHQQQQEDPTVTTSSPRYFEISSSAPAELDSDSSSPCSTSVIAKAAAQIMDDVDLPAAEEGSCSSLLDQGSLDGKRYSSLPSTGDPSCLPIIAIDGPTGAGKSMFVSQLSRHIRHHRPHWRVLTLHECLDAFTTYRNGMNPLALSYANPLKNIVAAQILFARAQNEHFRTQLTNYLVSANGAKPDLIISDRTLYSSQVFVELHCKRGNLSDLGGSLLYDDISKLAMDTLQATGVEYRRVYFLNTCPEECMKRIAERGRPYEVNTITQEYIQDMCKIYRSHQIQWVHWRGTAFCSWLESPTVQEWAETAGESGVLPTDQCCATTPDPEQYLREVVSDLDWAMCERIAFRERLMHSAPPAAAPPTARHQRP